MVGSKETVEFCTFFQKLLDATNGEPSELERRYHLDRDLQKLADQVAASVVPFELDSLFNPSKIASPVDPSFAKLWEEYRRHWAPFMGSLFFKLPSERPKPLSRERTRSRDEEWELANSVARGEADNARSVVEYACEQFELTAELQDDGDLEYGFREGLRVHEHYVPGFGFDAQNSMRRFRLLRTVNVSKPISDIASGGPTSLLEYLSEAHKAFLLGADFGALILARSVLEKTLIELYGAQGKDLEEKIDSVARLSDIQREGLQGIRKRANNLVHRGDLRRVRKLVSDPRKFELWMGRVFEQLRELIETAPNGD